MADPLISRRARHLLLLALIGCIVLIAVYLLSVRTPLGQTLGDEVYLDRVAQGRSLKWIDKHVLKAIDIRILALLLVAVAAVGAIRRQWFAAFVVAGAYVGAMVSAEVLKVVLPRPVLAPGLETLMADKDALNTFPSGHSTLATSLALGLVILVPARARPATAIAGAAFAAFVASGVLAAGWHRPSDAAGGIALGLIWLGAAGALVVRQRGVVAPPSTSMRIVPIAGALIIVIAAVILVVSILTGRDARVPDGVSPLAFPLAELAIDIWAVAAISLAAMSLRDIELRPRIPS